MQSVATIVWQRLDVDGRDACRLRRLSDGWQLDGTAMFLSNGIPSVLNYTVACDVAWRSRAAEVTGWRGLSDVRLVIASDSGSNWTLNGVPQPLAVGCIDIDLSFTPATNLLALRRLALTDGQSGQSPAVYLGDFDRGLSRLDQTYLRIDDERYGYHAPRFDFETVLSVAADGFVTDYPGLWRHVP